MKRPKTSRTAARPLAPRLTLVGLWLVILLPPLVLSPAAKDPFRLPKLLVTEVLALSSLLLLLWRLRGVERVGWRTVLGHPALVALLPLVLVATAGLAFTDHPERVGQALGSLWIGAACVIGWSWALRSEEYRRLLRALIWPASLLALLVVLQFHEVYDPFRFTGETGIRLELTSLAGGAWDLAAYLVLPVLVAQLALRQATTARQRWAWGAALGLCVYALALTRTLSALVAVVVASLVLWAFLLPWRRFVAFGALAAVVGVGLGTGLSPLRERVVRKVREVQRGDLNLLLSGRLDGWRAAAWMAGQRPWLGVGHGAYGAEFGIARLALQAEGVRFFRSHPRPYFVNAHCEFLEVAAEWGWIGVAALVWGLGCVGRQLGRRTDPRLRSDLGLKTAAVVALALMAAVNFPLRIALVAYPHLLLLSWVLAPREETA